MHKKKIQLVLTAFVFISILLLSVPIIVQAQEEENAGHSLFMDRAYPYDTIPISLMNQGFVQAQQSGSFSGAQSPWTSIGPTPYIDVDDNYMKTGRVVFVKYYPNVSGYTQHPDWIYIAGHCGGLWKTENGQSSPGSVIFSPLTDGLQTLSSGAMAFDPEYPNTIYYGTGGDLNNFMFNYPGVGVYKSTDAGASWNGPYSILHPDGPLMGQPVLTTIFKIAVSPVNPSLVFLAEGHDCYYGPYLGGGLYRSTDGGVTWAIAPNTPPDQSCNDVVFSNDGTHVYAAGMGWEECGGFGYWISTNSGNNFTQITNSGFDQGRRTHLAISKTNNNIIYGVSAFDAYPYPNGQEGVYGFVSTNAGYNFTYIRIGTEEGLMAATMMFIQASPSNSQVAIVGYGAANIAQDLYRTTNGGASYSGITMPGADENNLDFNPYPGYENQIILGNDQGLWISNNLGDSWSRTANVSNLNNTLSFTEGYRVASSTDNQHLALGVEDASMFTKQTGTLWNDAGFGGDGTNVIASKFNPQVFVGSTAVYAPDNLRYSTNGGANWPQTGISWGYWDGDEDWMAPITQYPLISSPNTFYTPRRNNGNLGGPTFIDINVSTDNGITWSQNLGGISQISTQDQNASPQTISFCGTNAQVIYVSTKDWHVPQNASRLWKTSDGGSTWSEIFIHSHGVPDRIISSVVADPVDENTAYLSLSGFNSLSGKGNVFKTSDGGANWVDIAGAPGASGSLPALPVNFMIVRYISPQNQFVKQIIVGTDGGVFINTDCDVCMGPYIINWQKLVGLPPTVCLGLDYNLLSNKLRAAMFGRGVYESSLDGPIYIANDLSISNMSELNIGDNIVVGSGATLSVPAGCTINMPQGKTITIQDGGHFNVSSSSPVYFNCSNGSWGGIVFQGSATGSLTNCVFNNTTTPISVVPNSGMGAIGGTTPSISITYSTFSSGPISITDRGNVTIDNCTWNYSSSPSSSVCGVDINGSSNVTVQWCSINNAGSSNTVTGISVVQSSGANVSHNYIRNASVGIFASNSDANIRFNNLGSTGGSADVGIGLDNCTNPIIIYDTIDSYVKGISLDNGSSAVMHDNKVTNAGSYGMICGNSSCPRMTPEINGSTIYWDAGENILQTTTNGGDGIYIDGYSLPNMAEGYNTVWGGSCYFAGNGWSKYSVTDNCWVDNPPVSGKFCATGFMKFTYSPYSCTPPPGAGGNKETKETGEGDNGEVVDPPQPLVVDYGNNVYDTLKATTSNIELTADMQLYYLATKQCLQSAFTDAITSYKLVIQNYKDSTCSIESMKKILYCYGRMHADTSAYTDLRNYYLSLVSVSGYDTAFAKTAAELSRKCLVRKGQFQNAIAEYENAVQNSSNHSDSVSAQINVIEIYLLMANNGGMSKFTGQLAYLKPINTMDGLRMIKEKLYNLKGKSTKVEIPIQFSLSQNYPNPFNPTTTIKYALPQSVKVSIKIYDILGRLVKTLVNNEFKDAGYYDVTFDGSNFASGVYFYRIEAGKFVQSKKMVIVK
jgi:photosystem II stability/assembly factor-like uncharacterized protein